MQIVLPNSFGVVFADRQRRAVRMLGANVLIPRHPSVAKLFESDDTEGMVITELLVRHRLAVLLTLAAASA